MRISKVFLAKIQVFCLVSATLIFTSQHGALADTSPTNSTVTTQEACTWWYDGIPTEISLTSGGVKYEGLDLELTKEDLDPLRVWVSGNNGGGDDFGSNTECTWYRTANIQGAEVLIEIDGVNVTSSPDDSMDFSLNDSLLGDGTNGFTVSSPGETCDDFWVSNDLINLTTADTAVSVTKALPGEIGKTKAANSGEEQCSIPLDYAATIPGDLVPTAAGSAYSFSLPTVVWTITFSTSVV